MRDFDYLGARTSAETVWRTNEQVRFANIQIEEIEREQRNQFLALSADDQSILCDIVGLGYLESYISTVKESPSAADVLKSSDFAQIPHKPIDALGGTKVGPPKPQTSQPSHQIYPGKLKGASFPDQTRQRTLSTVGSYASDVDEMLKQNSSATIMERTSDVIPIPHKRIDALRGTKSGPSKTQTSLPSHHKHPGSRAGAPSQAEPPAPSTVESHAFDVDKMLRHNQEQQRYLANWLRHSREDILEMQVDIAKAEEETGSTLPRVDVDIDKFLRERDVDLELSLRKGEMVSWWDDEEGQETKKKDAKG